MSEEIEVLAIKRIDDDRRVAHVRVGVAATSANIANPEINEINRSRGALKRVRTVGHREDHANIIGKRKGLYCVEFRGRAAAWRNSMAHYSRPVCQAPSCPPPHAAKTVEAISFLSQGGTPGPVYERRLQ